MLKIVSAKTEQELCRAVVLYCKENNIERNCNLHFLLHRVALRLWNRQRQLYSVAPTLSSLGVFDLVVADPPWPNDSKWVVSPSGSYPRMSFNAIKALPVNEITSDQSLLLVWTCGMYLRQTIEIIESWGFAFISWAFVWLKTSSGKPRGGYCSPYYPTKACEIVLMGKKGKAPRIKNYVLDLIVAERRAHSQKPEEFWTRVDAWLGDQYPRRLEMFAREKREGWTVWGNQV